MNDQELEQRIRAALDATAPEPDELARAALRAGRYRALEQLDRRRWSWWQGGGLALASIALAAVLSWQLNQAPANLEVASNLAEDAAVIADLDLVLWLGDGDV